MSARPLAPHVPGELLARLVPALTPDTPELAELLAAVGVRAVEPLFPAGDQDAEPVYRLSLDPERDLAAAAAALQSSGLVVYAEPNYLVAAADYTPDDPAYSSSGLIGPGVPDLWGLHTINMGGAWELTHGSSMVIVAVIDTGIDPSHSELAGSLWENAGEVAGNGLDDDGNGFIDDRAGWDFVSDDALPTDDNGHGTHVAGTIAAAGDNGEGVVGVAWGVRVMALKTLDHNGLGSLELGARAIRYAADMGAQVINCSWGAGTPSRLLEEAVAYAQSRGALVVAAAGNSGVEVSDFVPAALPGVLAVAATDPDDGRSSFSNYGAVVGVAAPGRDILSLLAAGTEARCARPVGVAYCLRSGTSMAAAHVAGLAALLRSRFPGWPSEAISEQIRASAVNIDAALGPDAGLMGAGRIDAAAALRPDQGALAGTVRDAAAAPVGGAILRAGLFTAIADADGAYAFPPLPPGDYTLSVGHSGYQQQRIALTVAPGATLTRDLILEAAAPAQLGGRVGEAGRGWPLYARVAASALGDERVTFSDPLSGAFVLELDAGVPYSLTVEALYPGYEGAAFDLILAPGLTDRTVDLSPDLATCVAPGYGPGGGSCGALAGALLVGAVADAVSGVGLTGTILSAGASSAVAVATSEDQGQPDGLYALFVPSGTGLLGVTHDGYEPLDAQVSLALGAVAWRGLALAPLYRPALVAVGGSRWGMPGATVAHTLRLENRGSRRDRFTLSLAQAPGCAGLPWRAAITGPQGELAPGEVAELTLRVTVPTGATYGASCAISLAAASQGAGAARASLSTSTRAGPGLVSAAAEALPGSSISRTLTLTGWAAGMADALLMIEVDGGRWPVAAPSAASLSELASAGLALTVAVPPGARASERDSAEVRLFTAGGEELAHASFAVTALPVYGLDLTALTSPTLVVPPGGRAGFTLHLTNSGNITDSYTFAASSDLWPVELPARLGPLAPGETATFVVIVQLPTRATGREALAITARSVGDPARAARLDLSIAAWPYSVFLPLIARSEA